MEKTSKEIAKKLNKHYYGLEGDTVSHIYIVGSVGRNTAIRGISDLDILFVLPKEVYNKYDNYTSNGQSSLLQDVKSVLVERYPRTDISGDGQVVVIEFDKYTVELVPGFNNTDGSFTYPDTHNGGSWKITKPIPEQEECKKCNESSNGIFFDICHMIRRWKNTMGFSMGGLLIDTLVYNCFLDNNDFKECNYNDYLSILSLIFEYFMNQQKDRSYWFAVGSNQKVYNSDNGVFVGKAKAAYKKICDAKDSDEEINDVLVELFGVDFFPTPQIVKKSTEFNCGNKYDYFRGSKEERFIDELFPVDIRYSLKIDCVVTQDGFRPFRLSEYLLTNKFLNRKKRLDFQIINTNCPTPYLIYWKVRNVGYEAIKRNMVRGAIVRTDCLHQKEHTDFYGPHYVECYLVKNNVCVAKAHIKVPIE